MEREISLTYRPPPPPPPTNITLLHSKQIKLLLSTLRITSYQSNNNKISIQKAQLLASLFQFDNKTHADIKRRTIVTNKLEH